MKTGKTVLRIAALLLCTALALLLLLPFPREAGAPREVSRCVWSDGTVSEESYASAYALLGGVTQEGITLSRGDKEGSISFGSAAAEAYGTLMHGTLGELLALSLDGTTRLERAALYRAFGSCLYYDGGYFALAGGGVSPCSRKSADTVMLLSGSLPRGDLSAIGAESLVLRADAAVSADMLCGSRISFAAAEAPYHVSEGGIYLDTAGGKRLVAALPSVTRFAAGECDWADEGALAACTSLCVLDLPFLGSAADVHSSFRGELGYLFGEDREGRYAFPETLAHVRIRGGTIVSHAFYGADTVRSVNACGVAAGSISRTAFAGLPALVSLHCPRGDVSLSGDFSAEVLSCGCTLFSRA